MKKILALFVMAAFVLASCNSIDSKIKSIEKACNSKDKEKAELLDLELSQMLEEMKPDGKCMNKDQQRDYEKVVKDCQKEDIYL